MGEVIRDEGSIKFHCRWIKAPPPPKDILAPLNEWRERLYKLGLIGVYPDGIGYGNISRRWKGKTFIVTGSATGSLKSLNETHYVFVKEFNFGENSLLCEGPLQASSESLSHAMIYECSPETQAVLHVHHGKMWDALRGVAPTTDKDVPYGTPAMAAEIKRLFDENCFKKEKLIVMGGHPEGVISFGNDLEEAGRTLLKEFEIV